jgi:tetratricopeptide (TPR) repeat protein
MRRAGDEKLFRPSALRRCVEAAARYAALLVGLLSLLGTATSCVQEDRFTQLSIQADEPAQEGRYAEAIPIAEEAVGLGRESYGPEHLWVARSLNSLATLYSEIGRYEEAVRTQLEALRVLEENWLHNHGDPDDSRREAIKAELLRVFYPDDSEWREVVWKQAREVVEQALTGLRG